MSIYTQQIVNTKRNMQPYEFNLHYKNNKDIDVFMCKLHSIYFDASFIKINIKIIYNYINIIQYRPYEISSYYKISYRSIIFSDLKKLIKIITFILFIKIIINIKIRIMRYMLKDYYFFKLL